MLTKASLNVCAAFSVPVRVRGGVPAFVGGYEAAVDGIGEGCEGVAGVRGFVVEGLGAEGSVSSFGAGSVVFEGVEAGGVGDAVGVCFLAAACVDDAVAEEFTGVLYAVPFVLSTRDKYGGVACETEGLLVGGFVEVAAGAVVREDAGRAAPELGVHLAEDVEVMVYAVAVGGVVGQQEPFALVGGLHPPDGHEVCHAEVPAGVDGAMGLHIEGGGDVATLHEVVELDGEDGAVHDVVEGFLRRGGVFLFDL